MNLSLQVNSLAETGEPFAGMDVGMDIVNFEVNILIMKNLLDLYA